MKLGRLLAREQQAYLRRDRGLWKEHLAKAWSFFGEALRSAEPGRPVLILGAGTGLELPWRLAPAGTTGWDADPWSRLGTALRHRRFPPWVFQDFTGGFDELGRTIQRSLLPPGPLLRRPPERAAQRLAGLVPSLRPEASPLQAWIAAHRPGTVLVANVLGQLGCTAERLVEAAFRPAKPWPEDPDGPDPLSKALDAWTLRALQAVLACLHASDAAVWMIHDRAVLHGATSARLGPLEDPWSRQLQSDLPLEVSDPLLGLDLRTCFPGRAGIAWDRWLWPVGPGQVHLMEALAFERPTALPGPEGPQTV